MRNPIAGRSPLPALFVAFIAVACGQATADTQAVTPVAVTITVPPATSQAIPPSAGSITSSAPVSSLLPLVTSVSLSVIDSANQPVMGATTVSISPGQTVSVTLDVLSGPARTFVGRAMDIEGRVLFQGQSSPVALRGEPVSVGIVMTLNPFPVNLSVTTSGTGSGTVTSSPEGIACSPACMTFTVGTDVTLTAAPDATSMFTGWAGAGCTGTGTCTVTIDAAKTVTATFSRIQYALGVTTLGTGGGTVSSSPPGIDCGTTCTASFDAASSVTLTAAPDATSTFTGWAGSGCAGTGTCTVMMTAAQSVTATFTPLPPVIDPNGLSLKFGVIGDTLKIKGSGFGAPSTNSRVTVGTVPATAVQRWSDQEIVALIPAGLSVSSTGIPYNVIVTANGQESNQAFITLFDRVLGVGGKNGEINFDQFVLQTNQVTEIVNVLPGDVDGGSSSGVAISADGATVAEADDAIALASAASERVISFNPITPSVAQLTVNVPAVNVYGQDIAVSGDGKAALIAAFVPDTGGIAQPSLVRVTDLDSLSPVSAELAMPTSECVHEVALSADGDTAAVITGALAGCSSFSSPVKIYRIDNVLSSPTYTEVAVLTSSTTPPDRFTDLALSADGSTLIAGRIVFDTNQNEWTAGILRITGFKTAPIPHNDSFALALYSPACPPTTVDVDLSAEGATAIVGVVKPADQLTCPAVDHVFQIRDADLGLATAPLSVVFPVSGSAVTNLEGVALNSGGSIALVRTNLAEAALVRVDAFNTATPVSTNLPPTGSLANMNLTPPPRPQDYVDLQ